MNTKFSDIAIIGMAGRFPGAGSVSHFWKNICEGKESVSSLSDEELRKAGVSEADINDSLYVKASALLDDIDKFDPAFFKISPVEAELMDPQIRLLLQCAWEVLEDSGHATKSPQNIGVFAGSGGVTTSYFSNFINRNSHFEKITTSPTHLGNDKDFLATYISYRLNLTGPSMTVQTACSTSMVAVHQACLSLLNDECEMALAGGVSIRIPHVQGYYYKEGYLFSKSGHVRTFDEQADGVVFGSGLGLVLVKRLENAVKDGDHIYAVIKGTAITNDGKEKMSYAASSAKGQIKCIGDALKKAQVDPSTIGFVESHGTGTFMGDPEEVKALSAAFRSHTDKKNYCALGAVKTNIGHLDSASGITGLIKTVLTLKHRIIPPTLHYQKPNPRIKFEKTPFFVNNTLTTWEDNENPRRAGVNSLGVGGTNAFVVLEEYISEKDSRAEETINTVTPVVVPLSAKTQQSLQRSVENLLDFIATPPRGTDEINITGLSYTLQVGREAMEHRVAFIVSSIEELKAGLSVYLEGMADTSHAVIPRLKQDTDNTEIFTHDGDDQEVIKGLITGQQWRELAELWVNGQDLEWSNLYGESKPPRVSLPTYSFEKQRYWIETGHMESAAAAAVLHPLLHANTSDISMQSYSTLFNGEEFFLRDHQVQGQKVLPGVAYLEMARAAVEKGVPAREESSILELRNIVWVQPIVVNESKQVTIALGTNDAEGRGNERIDYEIYSFDNGQEIVHCQGQAVFGPRPASARLDVAHLKKEMGQGKFDASCLYPGFNRMGLNYGPAFRGITTVYLGDGQLLATLRVPGTVEGGHDDFILHPSLMDGALQASLGLIEDLTQLPGKPSLPFALESIRILSACTKEMFAWARYSAGSKRGDKVIKLDVDLCDAEGNVCVQMRGFNSRVLGAGESRGQDKTIGTLFAAPVWEPALTAASPEADEAEYAQHHIVLCGMPQVAASELEALIGHSHCVPLHMPQATVAERYCEVALACFELIRQILLAKPQGRELVQIVIANDREETLLAGLSGLLRTVSLENPLVVGQIILADTRTTAADLAGYLHDNRKSSPRDMVVKYDQGARQVLRWQEMETDPDNPAVVFKDRGVYLITGGLGGLGILFAREIIKQTRNARIILTGRSELTAQKKALLDTLPALENAVEYRQLDITDPDQVGQLVSAIKQEHNQLNGIIHSAGMILDNFILKKTSEEFRQVLAPKVIGTYNLDQATQDIDLDFLVLFSSVTSAVGNLGQADYAVANGFMDLFAAHRNHLAAVGERHGKTLSINWPLWQEGGMHLDRAGQEMLHQTTGLQPMSTPTGMQALYRSLALPHDQTLVMEGDVTRMRRTVLADQVDQPASLPAAESAVVAIDPDSLLEKTQDFVRKQFSALLKLPSHAIDAQAPLENYGIDSMLALNLTSQLEKTFGSLSKTLFFEYQTIRELSEYFIQSHAAQLTASFATAADERQATVIATPSESLSQPAAMAVARRRFSRQSPGAGAGPERSLTAEPIAIIGLSGRYPEAANVREYWRNLRDGKDCIIEVPKDRWDWREYFSEDRTQNGNHFSKWGGFIEGVDEFDPRFFNISPVEAETLDPQERLFLQHAWMAVEDAGYTRAGLHIPHENDLAGQVGVYAGVMYGEYQLLGAEASMHGKRMGFASNPASIANRVSYFMNLHGPSMVLDTMCSSSLTAIHVACMDLHQRRTDLAIAGGVNVSIHPNKYLMLSAGQFISSDGHCQSFGEGGDGYIPGEGVGVVILKRLSEAERDGNHIYGVIRGSALNHGGKTNGYTVPNPQAQAGAIARSLLESNVNPRHISYIEAHGTGTKLGDPIEIAALTQVFHRHTPENGFCLIGSAKSNIGHCESAAGIAGLTKILMQMKYRQIVPSLHSERLNPHIDFEKTPFTVSQTLRTWEQPVIDGAAVPRIAGISSFGAGGSNAHLIVQEYVPSTDAQWPVAIADAHAGFMIPLSARTAEQLKQKARDLLDFIHVSQAEEQAGAGKAPDLVALAHTLQLGRESMDERLGLIAGSLDQLADKLQAYLDGGQETENVYQGHVKRHKEGMSIISQDDDMREAIDKWMARKKYAKLMDLWVKGLELDWNKLYAEVKPSRISLPAYPFARERFWIDTGAGGQAAVTGTTAAVLHPLLHTNTSDFSRQAYSSTFSGREFFFRNHHLLGEKALPAVGHLEMARAAIENASGAPEEGSSLIFRNVMWMSPVVVNGTPVKTGIGLIPGEDGEIRFEIYSDLGTGEEVVHSRGTAEYVAKGKDTVLDLAGLRSRTQRGTLSAVQCYQVFKGLGVEYGPGHQGIVEVHQGENEVLAKLALPSCVAATHHEYGLHPSLMDAALQSAIGLIARSETLPDSGAAAGIAGLPVSLESLEIAGSSSSEMYAWVRRSGEGALDIDLCDALGNIHVRMRGIESGPLELVKGSGALQREAVFLEKGWKPSPVTGSREMMPAVMILHREVTRALAETICQGCNDAVLILDSAAQRDEWKNRLTSCRGLIDLTCLEQSPSAVNEWVPLLQEVIEEKRSEDFRLLFVTQGLEAWQNNVVQLAGAERAGLYRMLQSEYPALTSRHVDLDPADREINHQAMQILQELACRSREIEVCYRNGQRYASVLQKARLENAGQPRDLFPDFQVLLVTGGTRGLGLLCARHMVGRYGVKRLVLTGREVLPPENQWDRAEAFSPPVREKIRNIQELRAMGADVRVMSFPLDDAAELERQYSAIRASLGNITGIIHAAGLEDRENPAFIRKTPESIARILSPKVEGVRNLMHILDTGELRFVVLFSSVSGIIPALGAGFSDYVMANAFMDYYATAHRDRIPVVSVQWPNWKESGMGEVKSPAYLNAGLLSISNAEGLELLDRVMADTSHAVVMPLVTDPAKFQPETLLQSSGIVDTIGAARPRTEAVGEPAARTEVEPAVQNWLRSLVEAELKLKPGEVDAETPFADYGVDSILLAQLITKMNRELEITIDPSVFFEFTTVKGVSGWLQATHSQTIASRFSLTTTSAPSASSPVITPAPQYTVAAKPRTVTAKAGRFGSFTARSAREPIAVVGMSCRFPGAATIPEYWNLLSQGRVAIAPVPEDCWGIKTGYHAGLVDDIFGFDPRFFMIPPEDAQVMDPQALVLLEEGLKAIYHSGYTHREVNGGNTGVYIGARSQNPVDMKRLGNARNPIVAVGQNYLAANLSQFFNFKGPSLVIDTACSSSLVGMQMAVEAMRSGVIGSALVGGVSLLTSTTAHDVFAQRNLHAANGEFHILDRRASGVVIGEGCGMVYLKPLSDAVRDGDIIHAEIAGISVNNDGRTAGPATPNIEAQKEVMQAALRQSGCSREKVGYLEVNGSGSEVTDLLEIKAITAVYAPKEQGNPPLYLGSMKPNIGHPLCAEGIASFIKVVLMLHHQHLVPFLSGQEPLPYFSITDSGFDFPRQDRAIAMKYAAVNCFADGGTNAHVVLKEGASRTSATRRSPLPLPVMNRVDVRTLLPVIKRKERAHPFIQSKAWSLTLTADHPVLANHRVYGLELLPGLAWIDLLYQWFEEAGYVPETLELRNLSIYRPLIVTGENPITLVIETRETGNGGWAIQVGESSTSPENRPQDSIYVTAEMNSVAAVTFAESVNPDEIMAAAESRRDLEEIYARYRTQELIHTGLMKAEGTVYTTPEATWIHVRVNDAANGTYRFHPTLIDGSGIGSAVLFPDAAADGQRLFLPLFYESFTASQPFAGECLTRITTASVEVKEELQSFTMEFFTPQGNKIGELRNFKNKLVRHAGLINSALNAQPQDSPGTTEARDRDIPALSFDSMETLLQSIIASQLGIDAGEVALDAGYYELGLESAMLLKVVATLESILSASLSPILLFEYTTIAMLAKYLSAHHTLPGTPVPGKAVPAAPTRAAKRHTAGEARTTHVPLTALSALSGSYPAIQDIAVIGMSGRYPQASNLGEFWENLKAGKDCITEIPRNRWDSHVLEGLKSPSGKSMSKWGGFIDDPDCFDPLFFNISPKEAEALDPQERLFLEVCWEAIEDAGYTPVNLVSAEGENERRPVGVFAGVMHKDYTLLQNEAVYEGQKIPLSLNYAPIANRVSYFCNFHGPSMTIDTVCSSSLTAVHLAMESLKKGESKVALAGGVNLSLHPNKYQTYGLSDMHSSDGRCHTFGDGGDGYVSAEGVGAVLLKPLQAALEDGDHVYAVLKGSTINHVGKVSGITVPSPVAQGELIAECLKKTGVDPETISYIEAHGTGTPLGDPIEVQGLKRAFGAFTGKKRFCALGSVKSNIGHSESAAGISGLTKTILQLHHRTLVKSLHAEVVNPYLELDSSPFYVQTATGEWRLPPDAGTTLRRAGISSFGATGSNAHIILEEFPREENRVQTHSATGVLLPLSAKNPERLKEYATRLHRYLAANPATDLNSLAYTLQTGRIAFEERLIIFAAGIGEAVDKLSQWLEGKNTSPDVWHENVKSSGGVKRIFDADEDLQEAVRQLLVKGKLRKLAEFWVKGFEFEWEKLYEEVRYPRISLPTYPFAKERYWVDTAAGRRPSSAAFSPLHPLLHVNTSDLSRQSYTTALTGREFFLEDHQVKGQKVLPGVAYLEMARAAVDHAMPVSRKTGVLELRDIVWVQPVVVTDRKQVAISLSTHDGRQLSYEIYSEDNGREIIHCQGQAGFSSIPRPARLDVDHLHAAMQRGSLDSATIYDAYNGMGINHGRTLRGIRAVYQGDRQLLAHLSIPEAAGSTRADYLLHPSLMDSALQASIGLIINRNQVPDRPHLPFAVRSVRIFSPCADTMYAWVRYVQGQEPKDGHVPNSDIDLCDEQGNVCVQILGLSARMLKDTSESLFLERADDRDREEDRAELQSLVPVWNPVPAESRHQPAPSEATEILLLGDDQTQLDWLRKSYPNAQLVSLPPDATIDAIHATLKDCSFDQLLWIAPDVTQADDHEDDVERMIERQGQGVVVVFRIIKALLLAEFTYKELHWTIITGRTQKVRKGERIAPAHAGICGLTGSLAKEYPHWNLRLLDVDSLDSLTAVECLSQPWDKEGNGLAYRDGEWFSQGLARMETLPGTNPVYKNEGVYVVIGGAGGLGEVWSRFMIERYQARMVWIGRQELNEAIKDKIAALGQLGPAPIYIAADATKLDSLEQAGKEILAIYPAVNGVVHSAIVLHDQSITRMEEATFRAGLSAKVDISVNMARVFGRQYLDFMLFFSSVNSFVRGAGQSNYAAGCTFKDSFAQRLQQQCAYPVKIVNWGYWGNVGIVADESYSKRMERLGYGSIEPQEGMAALQALVESDVVQMACIKTAGTQPIAGITVAENLTCYPTAAPAVLPQVRETMDTEYSTEQLAALEHGLPDAEMERFVTEALASSLVSVGLFSQGISKLSGLPLDKQPAPYYERWLDSSIGYLRQQGVLNGDLTFTRQVRGLDEVWAEWESRKTAWAANPNVQAKVNVLDACLKALPAILSGRQLATDVMFPNSSMQLVEGIYKDNVLSDHYNEVLGATLVACIKQQVQADKESRIRILEIGAGTGGTTAKILPLLHEYRDVVAEYCYTDLSKAFLMYAEEHYQPRFAALTTAIFNVTKPVVPQAIATDRYDLVIATNVLHATPNIRETLRNAKAVLKNQGVLLLNEMSTWSLFNHMTFGLLEGWWLHEDTALRLPGCPGLTPGKWQKVLADEGYAPIFFPAHKVHGFGQQVIAAASDGVVRQRIVKKAPAPVSAGRERAEVRPVKAPEPANWQPAAPAVYAAEVTEQMIREHVWETLQACIAAILKMKPESIEGDRSFSDYGVDSIIAVQLINQINQRLKLNVVLQTTVLFDYSTLDKLTRHIVSGHHQDIRTALQEERAPLQASTSQPAGAPAPSPDFRNTGHVTRQNSEVVRQVVVVTEQTIREHVREALQQCIAASLKMKPESIEGARSFSDYGVDSIIAVQLINQINQRLNVVLQTTVLFDYSTLDQLTKHIAAEHQQTIRQVLQEEQAPLQSPPALEASVQSPSFDFRDINRFAPRQSEAAQQHIPLPVVRNHGDSAAKYQRVLLERPGEIRDVMIRESYLESLEPTQVCVAIHAFSLNFGDLLCVRGLYPTMPPYPFTPGYDASGVVIAAGQSVRKVRVGDSVIVEAGESLGAHATAMICEQEQVTVKPESMSFADACALPVVGLTMIDAFHKANLQRGESILIQTAAGGTGLIAVQLARHCGATIYATAGSPHKLDYLRSLGVSHCINYLEHDFESEIKRLTRGRGVDVVINTLSGDAIQKGMNCLAPGGRYIEIAMTALKSAKSIDLSTLSNNQSFYSIDMRKLGFTDPQTLERYRKEMLSLYQQGVITPTICRTYPFESIQEAYQALSDRNNIGKIVVTIPEALHVGAGPSVSAAAHVHGFRPSATMGNDPIAIIGMSGRFAESESLDEFWENLKEGKDLIKEVTRWHPAECATPESMKHYYCSQGSFVDSIDQFDPLFFRISPLEALYMDPQQRLFLEESWKALEDAGYAGKGMDEKSCGVYVGSKGSDYARLFQEEPPEQSFWGNAGSVIPARIAYYLNLHGPAVSVDTACSSSLVAIHLACQSLWARETEMALAGGVFLQSTPEFYQLCNRASMLSPEGRCKAFDSRANGFVLGEGVGAVVLKRLEDALRDGDAIRGVIAGSGINQDGATNGITAPSAKSQERLELAVYDRFNINPETIQVVEAHGTGTKLGDPIEYGALTRSFRRYTDRNQFCAIGSVKTNMGHAVSAAGVAGVIKLLLSMQHRQIPPSLHFQQGNPGIYFESSPFYVNTQLREWKTENNSKRRAAISSFGFSGTNAHLVIEEAPEAARSEIPLPGYVVVLSALSFEQLRQQVRNLLECAGHSPDLSLNNLSYTLFVGRMHMTHRLSCVARNRKELIRLLEQWLETGKASQVYVAEIKEGQIREQASLRDYANQRIRECGDTANAARYLENLAIIADLYVQGYSLDYHALFSPDSKRIHLSTYPFAKERYWVDAVAGERTGVSIKPVLGMAGGVLHPLLHANTSDFSQQSYSSTFSGEEFFLKDHQVQGHRVLPGVVYLEMARAAIALASPVQAESGVLELHHTVWLKPVVVAGPKQVSIALFQHDGGGRPAGAIDYEIYSQDRDAEGHFQEILHCQGQAVFIRQASPVELDLVRLREEMGLGSREGASLYPGFAGMGLVYGPAHQGIASVFLGDNQLLAHLCLPAVVEAGRNEFLLHPALMDSALQASICLIADVNHLPDKPFVPFALETLRILSPCTEDMFAWVRYSRGSQPETGAESRPIVKLDIDLCDQQGKVCVQILGITSRVLELELKSVQPETVPASNFDNGYYERLIESVLHNDVSADEAVELS